MSPHWPLRIYSGLRFWALSAQPRFLFRSGINASADFEHEEKQRYQKNQQPQKPIIALGQIMRGRSHQRLHVWSVVCANDIRSTGLGVNRMIGQRCLTVEIARIAARTAS